MAFASNWSPVSDVFLLIAFPLQYFRAPMRTLLPLLFLLTPLALLSLPAAPEKNSRSIAAIRLAMAFLLMAIAWFLPPAFREFMAWALAAALLSRKAVGYFGGEALLAPLALLAVLAFGMRLPKPLDLRKTPENIAALKARILQQAPELADPLTRATLDFQDEKFHANTAHVIGISSLDGYWQPLRAYNELTSRIYGVAPDQFALNFRISSADAGAAELFRLYNVKYQLHLYPDGELKAKATGAPGKRAWLLHAEEDRACGSGEISRVTVLDPFFSAAIDVGGLKEPCRLVLPINFAANLRAYSGSGTKLQTNMAEGGLFSALLVPGEGDVLVRAEPLVPAWMNIFSYIGYAIAVLTLLAALRRRAIRQRSAE